MLIYESPIKTINLSSFDDLSCKIAEIEAVLTSMHELCSLDNQAGLMLSVTERLCQWLHADVLALHTAYRNQHGGYFEQGGKV
ncbi:hypothetical protein SAMN02745130_02721 [Thiothrix eikelboomii]|uniref:Uncharacterized protein n=1 Tax=Thiothrix eikelboomii TaxID=92487 RepID=A0A1T4XA54_9GAMM|nr:hypothetical protein [Thiothrix eikelboomii]SKA86500.1 hypothetical protein SAMN02745130_02721 [Thiothrix eikelboomii]